MQGQSKAQPAPKPVNKSGYYIPQNTEEGRKLSNNIYRLERGYRNILPPKMPQPPGEHIVFNPKKHHRSV
jgi:hypothetical protein